MKNCPFCNGSTIGPCSNTHPHGHEIIMMFCNDCGACGPVIIYKCPDDIKTAMYAWDNRHNVRVKAAPKASGLNELLAVLFES